MTSRAATGEAFAEGQDPGKLGLWLFLLSEILLFGGFFASYFMSRWGSEVCALGSSAWPEGTATGGLILATINTFILITSSYTMVRALAAAQAGKREVFHGFLKATMALGAAFLVVKSFEYYGKVHHGFYLGSELVKEIPGYGMFFSYYYLMTGLHALHVVVGLVWMFLLLRSREGDKLPEAFVRKVEYGGLYWHFVDLVWVLLYPLFYIV